MHTPGEPPVRWTGANSLGPHVVGVRVVVRRRLPDGSATDVLGTCTSFDDSSMIVAGPDGPVRIALRDIIAGKPVPPRASVRLRTSPQDAEEHGLVLWPGVETTAVGHWTVRHLSGSRRKRANSALAFVDPGMPLDDALDQVTAHYRRFGLPALVQVLRDESTPGVEIARGIEDRGWEPVPGGDTLFLIGSVASITRRLSSPSVEVALSESAGLATARVDTDAIGLAALDGDWVGIRGIEVRESRRRAGLATAVLADLLDWAASQGALTAWLHVEVDNLRAREWYERLGMRPHHSSGYLRAPTR